MRATRDMLSRAKELRVAASEGTGVARVELALAAALTTHGDHSEALVAYDEVRR